MRRKLDTQFFVSMGVLAITAHLPNRKKLVSLLFVLIFFLWIIFAGRVNAQAFRYPVVELGYCRDAKECSLYCEIPQNKAACWSYGKYKLYPQVLGESTDDEQEAKKLGITFPIKELGNCVSVTACKAFCDVSANQQTCQSFAQKKGIGQYAKHQEMLTRAKETLGCDSYESCKNFCENEANRQLCMEFADKYAPEEYRQKKQEILERARTTLGCDSFESCKNYCENPDNREKCKSFAREHAPSEVKERMQQMRQEKNNTCSTEDECRKWCEQNPDKCPGYKESGDYKRHQEEQKYYQNYSQPTYQPQQYPTSFEQPQNYPTSYQLSPQESQQSGYSGSSDDQATQCSKTPGCSWTGSTCQCSTQ